MGYAEFILSLKEENKYKKNKFVDTYKEVFEFDSIHQIENFSNVVEYNSKSRVVLPKNMDLLSKIYLKFRTNKIDETFLQSMINYIHCTLDIKENLGYLLLKKCSLLFDETVIQNFNEIYLRVLPFIQGTKDLDALIGNQPELQNFGTIKSDELLYIPIPFYFNEYASSLISKEFDSIISIEFEFSSFHSLYEIGPHKFIRGVSEKLYI